MAGGLTNPFKTVWFYNSDSGSVISEPALGDTIQAHLPGWHGPFGTKQEALDFYASGKSANPGWKAPTGFAGAVGNTVSTAAGNALKYSLSFGNTTGLLSRILKVGVGVILIVGGLMVMLPKQPELGIVTQLAGRLPGV